MGGVAIADVAVEEGIGEFRAVHAYMEGRETPVRLDSGQQLVVEI